MARALTAPAICFLYSGVLYHVLDPLGAVIACRRSVRRRGYAILESAYDVGSGSPSLIFNPADPSLGAMNRANVFWRPSKSALEAMCRMAGFEVIATVAVDNRLAILTRAERPSEIRSRSPLTQEIHHRYMKYANYREAVDFRELEDEAGPPSSVEFRGESSDRRLYPGFHRPASAFQPEWTPPGAVIDRARRAARSAWLHGVASTASARGRVASTLARAARSLTATTTQQR